MRSADFASPLDAVMLAPSDGMFATDGFDEPGLPRRKRQVFVSYSRRDSQVVDGCVKLLLTAGASVFYDTLTIPPGTNPEGTFRSRVRG